MNIDELKIGELKQLAALFTAQPSMSPAYNQLTLDGSMTIVVLQRGHIAVGIYYQCGDIGRLTQAATIRRWGTTEGLGELAIKGPLENTRLDKCPNLTFHIREVIMSMEVSDAWRSYFDKY